MEHELLARIAAALERLAPLPAPPPNPTGADAFIWHPAPPALQPIPDVARVPLSLLQGLEQQKTLLLANTTRFAAGLPANNAMLWGARGMGKSSLIKAVHAACPAGSLALIEIAREDIATLPTLLHTLRNQPRRCLVFCDDLSFEREDADYKALKSVLDGGIAGRPANVLFYATSNRRHLMPRDMIDNERATAISPGEATEEKVSLSDRFGLWLGFHGCSQEAYLAMVAAYAADLGIGIAAAELRSQAIEWAITRGARSGRVAWQFIQSL
jgi:predicted AAA+ superfamily ATPase